VLGLESPSYGCGGVRCGFAGVAGSGDGEAEVHFAVSQVQEQPFLMCHAAEGGVRCPHLLGRGTPDGLTERVQRFRQ